MSSLIDNPIPVFNKESHVKYFKSSLNCLPDHYTGLETSKISAIYFAVVALDILGALDTLDEGRKREIIEYIYMLQIASKNESDTSKFGFIGSPYLGHNLCLPCNDDSSTVEVASSSRMDCGDCLIMSSSYVQGHIAMTYTALATLLTLGDDLKRVDKSRIIAGLKLLQQQDGSFGSTVDDNESDLRFLFCACAISFMLKDWSGVDQERAVSYVLQCLTYEGGIALTPGAEAQGGACYCGLASLALMGRIDALSGEQQSSLLSWCEQRQGNGFQGRTNKEPDSCYSFWVGGTISLLGGFHCTDLPSTRHFLLASCQFNSKVGGFSKLPGGYPDILHSFYSICWLAMAGQPEDELRPLDVKLGVCEGRF